MRIDRRCLLLLALLVPLLPSALEARQADTTRIAELERRLDALGRELERMRLGEAVVTADSAVGGLGPAASRVYRIQRGVSVGGYGEILYENFAGERDDGSASGTPDRLDALRAILYVGYKFDDRLLFNSEIEVEHADEIFLEFAYVDYRLHDAFGLRAGMLLAPLGLVNELHEPPVYLGTERPVTEQRIIPTTWRENGLGAFGAVGGFEWRAYVLNSLDGAGFGAAGLRGGRQKGSKALAEDLGVTARLDWTGTLGLVAGASVYHGGTAQGRALDGMPVRAAVTVWDLHADWRPGGWELRGLLAGARLDEAGSLNRLNGLEGSAGAGSSMLGGYVQAGYDVLRATGSGQQLLPWVRWESVDTQREVPTGFSRDPATDLRVLSFGLAWKPVPQVVFQAGRQARTNDAGTAVDQWNVHLGWLF